MKCPRSTNGLINTFCKKWLLKVTEDIRDLCTKKIGPAGRTPKISRIPVRRGKECNFFFCEVRVHLAAVKSPGLFFVEFDHRFKGALVSQLPILTGERAGVLQAILTGTDRICVSFSASQLPRACKEIKGNNKV